MTGRYKAYPEYKNSGVEWVGDIPASWTVKPTFSVFDPSVSKNTEGQQSTVLSLSYGNIVERDVDTNFGLLPESFNTYQIVRDGDLILRLTDLQNDKKSLRVGLVKQTGIITSAYLKLRSNQSIDYRFAYRLFHSYDTTKVFYGMGGGLRQSMKFEDFRRLPILVPPLEEQQKIANFLDHETAKIDTLITKQERLIELLKEKRQAVISHAVTKGLPSINGEADTPMKDSGVEWLGEVPEHWGTSRLKFVTSIFGRIGFRGYTTDDIVDEGEGALVLSPSNVLNGKLDLNSQAYLSWDKYYESPEIIVEPNDILLVKTGSTYGKSAIVESNSEPMTINPQMALLKKSKIPAKYLAYVMSSDLIKATIKVSNTGSGMPTMTQENINSFPIPIPSDSEAKNIVNFLDQRTANIDNLIKLAGKAIEIINERKTALISAAVTGKIDVRDWQPQGVQG